MKPENKINIGIGVERKNIKYNEEVFKYIHSNEQDKAYYELVQSNPEEVFSGINNMIYSLMEANLFRNTSPSGNGDDEKILSVELNIPEQYVIKNDCHRTRVRENHLIPGFEETLEKLLTYFCFSKNIKYKQGLNEIFGALLFLRYKIPTLKLSKIFDLGEVFIDRFSPNYFYESEFYSLKSALALFVILLRYHEPCVYNKLDQYEILPEMYATNWMMTFLSGKIRLDLIYDYWLEIIKTEDPLILHFILVSFIILKRELIIKCDYNLLAALMSSLTIRSKEEIKDIIDLALKLREQTPYSFRILANKLGFLKNKNENVKQMYEKYHPELLPAMPIFPLELLSLAYKSGIDCIDPECKNSKNKILSLISKDFYVVNNNDNNDINILNFQNNIDSHICEKCDMKIKKDIKYLLLDLRIKTKESNSTGILRSVVEVAQEELLSPEFSKIITDRFLPERGLYHFIFLTTNTDFYSDFENKFYTDNTTEEQRMLMMCGAMNQTKIQKEINLQEVSKNLNDKEIYNIKEYDNMKNTLNYMQKENFPYVGFVLGGFEEIHEESYLQEIEILNHNEKKCYLCLKKKNNKKDKHKKDKKEKKDKTKEKEKDELANELWISQKKILYEDLNKILENKNNYMCLCIIKYFKGKDVDYNTSFVLKEESFTLEIYKFDNRKQYNDLQLSKDDIEIIKKNRDYYDLGRENDEKIELTLMEEISISLILGIKADSKNKNIININYKENITDKKISKNKGTNYLDQFLRVDFPTPKDSMDFVLAFKHLTEIYKSKKKKNKK